MPLDTGDNKPRYGWSQEARRIYGEPSSSFCNFDVDFMSAPVAVMMKDPKTGEPVNPSLDESCHYSRMGAYLDLNPLEFPWKNYFPCLEADEFISILSAIGIKDVASKYQIYLRQCIDAWPWNKESDYDFEISDDDQKRIKECFFTAIMMMAKRYCNTTEKRIAFEPLNKQ